MQKTAGVLRYLIDAVGGGDTFSIDPFVDPDANGNTLAQGMIPASAILTAVAQVRTQGDLMAAYPLNVNVGAPTFDPVSGYKTSQPVGVFVAGVGGPDVISIELVIQSFQAGATHGYGA